MLYAWTTTVRELDLDIAFGDAETRGRRRAIGLLRLLLSFEVFETVCREEGAVIAHDPDDMVRAAHFLVHHPRPRHGGVGILSGSGGAAGIAADRVSELGLRLAVFSPATRARLLSPTETKSWLTRSAL